MHAQVTIALSFCFFEHNSTVLLVRVSKVDVGKYSPEQDGNGVYDDEEGIWSNTFHQQVKELNLAGQNVTLPAIVQSLHSLLSLILSILHIEKDMQITTSPTVCPIPVNECPQICDNTHEYAT